MQVKIDDMCNIKIYENLLNSLEFGFFSRYAVSVLMTALWDDDNIINKSIAWTCYFIAKSPMHVQIVCKLLLNITMIPQNTDSFKECTKLFCELVNIT